MSNRSVGAFERDIGFTDKLILDSFMGKMFKAKTCVCCNPFKFLCERSWIYLQKNNMHMRETILVESVVALSLQIFGIGNTLCTVGKVYEVAETWGGSLSAL